MGNLIVTFQSNNKTISICTMVTSLMLSIFFVFFLFIEHKFKVRSKTDNVL